MPAEPQTQQIGTTNFGLFRGLSYDEYARIDALRHSHARKFEKTSMHARYEILNPKDDTRATQIGTALHVAVLEPMKFRKQYAVGPEGDRRYKEGKKAWLEFEQANPNSILLSASEYQSVAGMAESILSDSYVETILSKAKMKELTGVWDEGGVSCKFRIDLAAEVARQGFIIDLKSTKDASEFSFAKDIGTYGYYSAAGFYLRGLEALKPSKLRRRWLWVIAESVPPYAMRVLEPTDECLKQGEEDALGWVRDYADAMRANSWPGWPSGPQYIDLPAYKRRMVD